MVVQVSDQSFDNGLAELRNLLCVRDSGGILHAIFDVELDANRIISDTAVIHTSTLDANLIGHDLQLSVQATATVYLQVSVHPN